MVTMQQRITALEMGWQTWFLKNELCAEQAQ